MNNEEQKFLNELDKKLWTAANKLLPALDAAVYKHAVLGLIFLKYVSDAFGERRKALEAAFKDPSNDYYLGEDADDLIQEELEVRDYYTEKNVFWVPALARWENLQNYAKVAPGTEIEIKNGKTTTYKVTSTGKLIDDALDAVEKENEKKLKGVLNKTYTQLQIEPAKLGELIDLIATIPFNHNTLTCQRYTRTCLRILPRPIRLGRRQKRRPVLHPKSHRHADCGNAATLQRPRVRPRDGIRWLLRAIGKFYRKTPGQIGRYFRVRPGIQPHHLAVGGDEHGYSRH
jgi:hypothetical protein